MPPKAAASASAWQGAAPVVRDGFAYGNGIFFADASGNRHARASVSELQQHFKSGNANDHPAHWFEAQLLHYDLKPSKTKSVARMRLLDAVNSGLAIPGRISKLDGDMKKEWTKSDREAKKAAQAVSAATTKAASKSKATPTKEKTTPAPKSKTTPAVKEKATPSKAKSTLAVKKEVKAEPKPKTTPATKAKGTPAVKKETKAEPKPKTTPTTKAKSTPAVKKEVKAEPKPKAAAATAKRKASEPAASWSAPKRPKAEPTSPATNSNGLRPGMARRGGIHQGPGRVSATQPVDYHSSPDPMPRQTARRSRPFHPQGRITSLSRGNYDEFGYGYDEQDAGEEEYETDTRNSYDSNYDSHNSGDPPSSAPDRLELLGLLNGGYGIRSETVEGEWPRLSHNLSLVLTLAGSEMWGQFDLGIIEGTMHFRERPATSSFDRVPFTWRGRENEGYIRYGNDNHGWVQFFGDGRIEGELDYMSIRFSGHRHPGQGTRSQVDAHRMRSDWNGYSEEQYEEENYSRWR